MVMDFAKNRKASYAVEVRYLKEQIVILITIPYRYTNADLTSTN